MEVAAASGREQVLREFTRLLIEAFPGSTIYENMDIAETANCVRTHRLDAVFIDGTWDAVQDFLLLEKLQTERQDLPVYVFSDTEDLKADVLWNGAADCVVRPVSAEQLKRIVHIHV